MQLFLLMPKCLLFFVYILVGCLSVLFIYLLAPGRQCYWFLHKRTNHTLPSSLYMLSDQLIVTYVNKRTYFVDWSLGVQKPAVVI